MKKNSEKIEYIQDGTIIYKDSFGKLESSTVA